MCKLTLENSHISTVVSGTCGHQESQHSDKFFRNYVWRTCTLISSTTGIKYRKKYDEKVSYLVPQGLYQSHLLNIYRQVRCILSSWHNWVFLVKKKVIYSLFKKHMFFWSQFSLVSPYKSRREKKLPTAQYSPFNICPSFWTHFFLPIHHMGKLR